VVNDWGRRVRAAAEVGRKLTSGPLAHMSGMSRTADGKLEIALGKTDYAVHHTTTPLQGEHTDWTRENNPTYKIEVVDSKLAKAVFNSPKFLGTAFAAAVLTESNDGKLVYGIRNAAVDCYRDTWSLPSGGRFSGNAHEAVDELIKDATSIEKHLKMMLGLEYPGIDYLSQKIKEISPLGIFRANDYDVTLAMHAKVDASAEELQEAFLEDKYIGAGSVNANSDGMVRLLHGLGHFPPTIQGVIGLAAAQYGVDATDRPTENGIQIIPYV
jgi:predicted transport protein